MSSTPNINFDNSFANALDGFYVPIEGHPAPKPELVRVNHELATSLNIDPAYLSSDEGINVLVGKQKADGSVPLAQAYAGHQFGGFSPSLGDGRAMLLGEVIDQNGERKDIQLKGSGRTPFSRGGDGKAALGPVLREYIISEAMHALGIPTTRALAAVTTGEQVYRDTPLPGAVLTRVASSHLRVGTFQFFAARGQEDKVKQLADYAIARHYPELSEVEDKYLEFLRAVINRQASLIAKWMSVGFIHGVMNTDNMTISGETIDYGPCAFLDTYKADTKFSSIDETGRYAYRMQPLILQWNLARLAECLLPLFDTNDRDNAVDLATEEINKIPEVYEQYWLREFSNKVGLENAKPKDKELIEELHSIMEAGEADFTLTFRSLSGILNGNEKAFLDQFNEPKDAKGWKSKWLSRIDEEQTSHSEIVKRMDAINPVYIPRNHNVEEALNVASQSGDYGPFENLLEILKTPFGQKPDAEGFECGAPETAAPFITYCGT